MAFQAFDDLFKRSRGRPPLSSPPPLRLLGKFIEQDFKEQWESRSFTS